MPNLVKAQHVEKKAAKKQVETKVQDEDRQPESAEPSDAGTISDDSMLDGGESTGGDVGASGSSSARSSLVTLTQADLEAMIENSRSRRGKWLLAEHEKSWDRKLKKMDAGQAKVLDKKISEIRHDLETGIDRRIDSRLDESERRMKEMTMETKKMIDEAKALVGRTGQPRAASEVGGETFGSASWQPKTLEIKGFCSFADRFWLGISSAYVADFTEKLKNKMDEGSSQHVDSDRTEGANKYTLCFKIVLVMREKSTADFVAALDE